MTKTTHNTTQHSIIKNEYDLLSYIVGLNYIQLLQQRAYINKKAEELSQW